MGLHEKILAELTEEERRRGRPLGTLHGLDSPALERRLAHTEKARPHQYGADLHKLYQYVRRGVRSQGGAMHFAALKKKYVREYAEFQADARGQPELL